jgi:uncharacterized protein
MKSWFARVVTWPIRLYQRFLSPLKPPMCRFTPTCSHYAHDAVLRHGVLRGGLLATWRILRCQPFSAAGPDPVPRAGHWRQGFRRIHPAHDTPVTDRTSQVPKVPPSDSHTSMPHPPPTETACRDSDSR